MNGHVERHKTLRGKTNGLMVAGFAHLPVVMLTTSSASEDRHRSLALGANHILTKPLSNEQLKELAQELSRE